MYKKLLILPLASNALHINRHHLALKLQALKEDYCLTENTIINGDVYPKALCTQRKPHDDHYDDLIPKLKTIRLKNAEDVESDGHSEKPSEEDLNELHPSFMKKIWMTKPGERFNDCFCKEGFIEFAETGECIPINECESEYQGQCQENEVYGLYISDEPHCKGYLDVNKVRNDPDIFDDIMDKIFGTSGTGIDMNWMHIFTPTQVNSMFDDACNEDNSPISEYCDFKFAQNGLVSVYNAINSQQQDQMRKVVFSQSYRYNKEAIDKMKMKRGCHCDNGYGRIKESSIRYLQDGFGNMCYNQCVKEEQCGNDFICPRE